MHCREFDEILEEIGNGTFKSDNEQCISQMVGHQAANLLTTPELINAAADVSFPREKEIVEEAIRNLRERITWIGLLDEIEGAIVGFKEVFPWLATNLGGEVSVLVNEFHKRGEDDMLDIDSDWRFGLENYIDKKSCIYHHEEEIAYTCGSREVGPAAMGAVARLNQRDLDVYMAAVERYSVQQEILSEYHSAIHLDPEP